MERLLADVAKRPGAVPEEGIEHAELVRTLTAIGRELGRFLNRRRPSSARGRSPSASSASATAPPRRPRAQDRPDPLTVA
jgi:hypothetical protein